MAPAIASAEDLVAVSNFDSVEERVLDRSEFLRAPLRSDMMNLGEKIAGNLSEEADEIECHAQRERGIVDKLVAEVMRNHKELEPVPFDEVCAILQSYEDKYDRHAREQEKRLEGHRRVISDAIIHHRRRRDEAYCVLLQDFVEVIDRMRNAFRSVPLAFRNARWKLLELKSDEFDGDEIELSSVDDALDFLESRVQGLNAELERHRGPMRDERNVTNKNLRLISKLHRRIDKRLRVQA